MASDCRKGDICVIGACNVDLITYVNRFPKPGETIRGETMKTGFGGKGANQAVQAAKLGAKVKMIGKVGKDSYGFDTLENFKKQGVDSQFVFQMEDSTVPSGLAPITVDISSGQNSIIIIGGANEHLSSSEIESCRSSISNSSWLVAQLELPQHSSLQAMKIAKEENTKVILNPTPAVSNLSQEFFEYSDIIVLNETELEMMTGKSIGNRQEAEEAGQFLLKEKQVETLIVTLGGEGALCITCNDLYLVPAVSVNKVVDTTGAGDSFIGSLVYSLSTGNQLKESIHFANRIAAISVQKEGTQTSYPSLQDLENKK